MCFRCFAVCCGMFSLFAVCHRCVFSTHDTRDNVHTTRTTRVTTHTQHTSPGRPRTHNTQARTHNAHDTRQCMHMHNNNIQLTPYIKTHNIQFTTYISHTTYNRQFTCEGIPRAWPLVSGLDLGTRKRCKRGSAVFRCGWKGRIAICARLQFTNACCAIRS